jgi:hypothetical protein
MIHIEWLSILMALKFFEAVQNPKSDISHICIIKKCTGQTYLISIQEKKNNKFNRPIDKEHAQLGSAPKTGIMLYALISAPSF